MLNTEISEELSSLLIFIARSFIECESDIKHTDSIDQNNQRSQFSRHQTPCGACVQMSTERCETFKVHVWKGHFLC